MSEISNSKRNTKLTNVAPEERDLKAIASTTDLQREGGACVYVERLATSYHAIQSQYRKRLWRALARAYQLASILSDSVEDWETFCADEYWEAHKRPEAAERKDANKWVVIRMMGHGEDQYRQISKYRIVLNELRDEGVDPEDAEKQISERGVARIVAEAAKHRPKGLDGKPDSPKNGTKSSDTTEVEDEASRAQAATVTSRSTSSEISEPTIAVQVTDDALWKRLKKLTGRVRLLGDWKEHQGNFTFRLTAARMVKRSEKNSHNAKKRSGRS